MAVDADSGKLLADNHWPEHNHEVAVALELGRGFISDCAGSIVIFNLNSNAVLIGMSIDTANHKYSSDA